MSKKKKKKGEKFPEYSPSEYEEYKQTKKGGAPVDLSKILKGPNKLRRMQRVWREVGQTTKRKTGAEGTKERKMKEAYEAVYKSPGSAAKKVKSYSKAHKARQEAQKVKAMRGNSRKSFSTTTGKARGHNLRRGQSDGDRGRKMASEERKL